VYTALLDFWIINTFLSGTLHFQSLQWLIWQRYGQPFFNWSRFFIVGVHFRHSVTHSVNYMFKLCAGYPHKVAKTSVATQFSSQCILVTVHVIPLLTRWLVPRPRSTNVLHRKSVPPIWTLHPNSVPLCLLFSLCTALYSVQIVQRWRFICTRWNLVIKC
jgi:hypothetical protein